MVEGGAAPVLVIDEARCDGCGLCLGACPQGALYLVEGKAVVDAALCTGCGSCIVACPLGTLTLRSRESPQQEAAAGAPVSVSQSQPPVIRVKTQPAPVPLRSKLLPAVGAALVWAGREIVPALAEVALDRLDRWVAEGSGDRVMRRSVAGSRDPSPRNTRGAGRGEGKEGGHRQRRRRQGGC